MDVGTAPKNRGFEALPPVTGPLPDKTQAAMDGHSEWRQWRAAIDDCNGQATVAQPPHAFWMCISEHITMRMVVRIPFSKKACNAYSASSWRYENNKKASHWDWLGRVPCGYGAERTCGTSTVCRANRVSAGWLRQPRHPAWDSRCSLWRRGCRWWRRSAHSRQRPGQYGRAGLDWR